MPLIHTLLLTFMVLIGCGLFNMSVLAAATNLNKANLNDDGGSTLITVTTTATSTTSAPTPSSTFVFPGDPPCQKPGCDGIYNKCITQPASTTDPKPRYDHYHCMMFTCYTYAYFCSACEACQDWGMVEE